MITQLGQRQARNADSHPGRHQPPSTGHGSAGKGGVPSPISVVFSEASITHDLSYCFPARSLSTISLQLVPSLADGQLFTGTPYDLVTARPAGLKVPGRSTRLAV
jgi:hypothetical protein